MENCEDFILHLEVANKSAFSISETPLGCADIDLMTIDGDGEEETRDYPLNSHGRMKDVRGKFRLNFRVMVISLYCYLLVSCKVVH